MAQPTVEFAQGLQVHLKTTGSDPREILAERALVLQKRSNLFGLVIAKSFMTKVRSLITGQPQLAPKVNDSKKKSH